MRLQQEIVLGIGGSRALEKLQLWPTIRHINEGHAAFVSLEKIRRLVQEENLTFAEAREVATSGNVFTTHTPVPAGIDVFTPELLWKYFAGYVNELGISFDEFFELGREVGEQGRELFSMAVLAMRLSTHQNAVSKLHAEVSRRLWRNVRSGSAALRDPDHPDHQRRARGDLDRARDRADGRRRDARGRRPDGALAGARGPAREARGRLPREARRGEAAAGRPRGRDRRGRRGPWIPKALTIGFARRFATYKRATLLFREPKRLEYLLHQIGRPVQILFAGKAHPRDEDGKEYLRAVATAAERPGVPGPRRLPVRLRHGARPRSRRRMRRLAEHPGASARGVRHVGHEGRDERRPEPLGPRRLVGRGAARRGRLRRRRRHGPCPRGRDRPRAVRHAREAGPPDVLRPRRLGHAAALARPHDRRGLEGGRGVLVRPHGHGVPQVLLSAGRVLPPGDEGRRPRAAEAPRRLEGAGARRLARRRVSRASRSCPIPRRSRPPRRSTSLARVHLGPLDASEVSVELFEGPIEADGRLESGTVDAARARGARRRDRRLPPDAPQAPGREPRLYGARPPDASRSRAPQRHGSHRLVGREEPGGAGATLPLRDISGIPLRRNPPSPHVASRAVRHRRLRSVGRTASSTGRSRPARPSGRSCR